MWECAYARVCVHSCARGNGVTHELFASLDHHHLPAGIDYIDTVRRYEAAQAAALNGTRAPVQEGPGAPGEAAPGGVEAADAFLMRLGAQ